MMMLRHVICVIAGIVGIVGAANVAQINCSPWTWNCVPEGGVCTAPGSTLTMTCASGTACSGTYGACLKPPVGKPCNSQSDCAPASTQTVLNPLSCVGQPYQSTCQYARLPGQSCSKNSDCSPSYNAQTGAIEGNCINGKCLVLPLGAPCSVGSFDPCLNYTSRDKNLPSCSQGYCSLRLQDGATCGQTNNPGSCMVGSTCFNSVCVPLPTAGQKCNTSLILYGGGCYNSVCLPISNTCTAPLSLQTGAGVCNTAQLCPGYAYTLCQSGVLNANTGLCVDYTPSPVLGTQCINQTYCATPVNQMRSPFICACADESTSTAPVAPGRCLDVSFPGELPLVQGCNSQLADIAVKCALGNGVGGISSVGVPPYQLNSDEMSSCCNAVNAYKSCVQPSSVYPNSPLTYSNAFTKCRSFDDFDIICNGIPSSASRSVQTSVSLVVLLLIALSAFMI